MTTISNPIHKHDQIFEFFQFYTEHGVLFNSEADAIMFAAVIDAHHIDTIWTNKSRFKILCT